MNKELIIAALIACGVGAVGDITLRVMRARKRAEVKTAYDRLVEADGSLHKNCKDLDRMLTRAMHGIEPVAGAADRLNSLIAQVNRGFVDYAKMAANYAATAKPAFAMGIADVPEVPTAAMDFSTRLVARATAFEAHQTKVREAEAPHTIH